MYFYWQSALHSHINSYFGAQLKPATAKYFLYYDEIRAMNWDPLCKAPASEYLAATANRAGANLDNYQGEIGRPMEKFIWNDMFDKQMNARTRYWQVNGDLTPSDNVKLNPSYVIVNWAGGGGTESKDDIVRRASLAQFHEAGHKQIAALYYDKLESVNHWLDVMSESSAPRLDGIMYTTWKESSNKLDGYADLAKVAELMRTRFKDRWPAKK